MQVVLVLTFVSAALATSANNGDNPLWASEELLGKYQDAWKSISQPDSVTYVLAKTTYENDTGSWGAQFKCLEVQETQKSKENFTVTSVFTFRNASSPTKYYNVSETVKAVFQYGYKKTRNAIEYQVGGEKNLTDPLIFTDGKLCDVFYVPYADKGCELWVKKSHYKQIPDCCMFVFNVFCANGRKTYDIFSEEECVYNEGGLI
ncbi:female-specific histamine-binding protein 2-like [Dermacentor silvarum]|uniref:female-specific histamine-binding protein 2-like n=1 Tax=Dermacentor silvarum TaxID=543639 RepID=UPI00210132B2|nr:female-specific histamine-binding protein 2-like [Dermacentor silvarum]